MVSEIFEPTRKEKQQVEQSYKNKTVYTQSRITRTRLYRIIAYFEGYLPHQKLLH